MDQSIKLVCTDQNQLLDSLYSCEGSHHVHPLIILLKKKMLQNKLCLTLPSTLKALSPLNTSLGNTLTSLHVSSISPRGRQNPSPLLRPLTWSRQSSHVCRPLRAVFKHCTDHLVSAALISQRRHRLLTGRIHTKAFGLHNAEPI